MIHEKYQNIHDSFYSILEKLDKLVEKETPIKNLETKLLQNNQLSAYDLGYHFIEIL